MCGRFGLIASAKQVALAFGAQEPSPILPRYNIAPTQAAWIVRSAQGANGPALVQLNWGLLPDWAGRGAGGRPLINARVETVSEKASFRAAYKHRRCVVPADGWYEWQSTATGKQPYALRPQQQPLFAMAGIWQDDTFAILTQPAAPSIAWLHARMPVLLARDQMDDWLSHDTHPLAEPWGAASPPWTFDVWPVGRDVNRVSTDGPVCREPIDLSSVERQLPLL